MVLRLLWLSYLGLRLSEGCQLGLLTWAAFESPVLVAAVLVIYAFAIAAALAAIQGLKPTAAAFWHFVLEVLIVPISLSDAWHAAHASLPGSPLSALNSTQRLIVCMSSVFLVQLLTALVGLWVVRLLAGTKENGEDSDTTDHQHGERPDVEEFDDLVPERIEEDDDEPEQPKSKDGSGQG